MTLLYAYNFDEASGNILDASGNGREVVYSGNLARTASAAGHTDKGMSQSTTAIDSNGPSITGLQTANYTVMAWVKRTSNSLDGWFCEFKASGSGDRGILFLSGNIQSRARNSGGTVVAASVAQPTAGTWYHAAGTYDGTTLRLFINGAQVATAALTAPLKSTSTSSHLLDALGTETVIDDVRYYDTALDAATITTLMGTPVGSSTTPVSATRATTWRAMARVTSTRAATWDVLSARTATRSATWDVLTAVTATRATTWRTRAVTTATRATTWRALAAATASRGTTWRTAVRATSTRLTTWRTQAQTAASRATTWRVRSSATATRSSTWNVASTSTTVVATRGTTWGVAGRVTATRPTTWDALAAVTATRSTTWDTTARATATRPTTWRTRAQVTATRNASWAVRSVTSGTRATTWDVTTLVTLTRAATWDALASLTATRTATWRTLGPATATRATTWAVESDLEPQAETVLTATHVASSALTAAHPQPELSPSNAPSSLLEVSHGV